MNARRRGTPDLRAKLRPTGAILHAHLAISRLLDADIAAHSEHDPTTLDLLLRLRLTDDGMRAVTLCEQLQKSASHISRIVERAEAKGLVERRVDPSDRRAQLIVLTEQGRRDLEDYLPHMEAIVDEVVFGTLSAKERETLVGLLQRLEEAARRYAE